MPMSFVSYICLFLLVSSTSGIAETLITGRPPLFSSGPFNYSVWEGEQLSLRCPVVRLEDRDTEWYYNDSKLPQSTNGQQYVDPAMSKNLAGIYRCFVANGIGSSFSPALNVSVKYLHGFIDPINADSFFRRKVVRGKPFIMTPPRLLASDGLNLEWTWKFNSGNVISDENNFITKGGQLVILNSHGRFGTYEVAVRAKEDPKHRSAESQPYYVEQDDVHMPSSERFFIVHTPQDVAVIRHKSGEQVFECVPALWRGQLTDIKWYLDGNLLIADGKAVVVDESDRRLMLKNPTSLLPRNSKTATVTCEASAENGRYTDSAKATISIMTSPVIDRSVLPFEMSYKIGDNVKLDCSARNAWPRARYTWRFGQDEIANFSSGSLSLVNISKSQFGMYMCEAVNSAGYDIAYVWVKFDEYDAAGDLGDLISEGPGDTTVAAGKNVSLTCFPSDKTLSVTWAVNGSTESISSSPKYEVDSHALRILSATRAESGTYSCIVYGPRRSRSEKRALVTVIGSTLLEYGPSNQSMLIGSNVRMLCKISDDYLHSDVTLTWYLNNKEIHPNGDALRRITLNADGSLSINQVGPENIGQYRCTARSPQGAEEFKDSWLKIIEKPSMPQRVAASLRNDTLPAKMRVDWRAGFDGNSPIIKYFIEMRSLGPTGLWSDWEVAVDNIPNESCCSSYVENLKPSSTVQFRVIAVNKHGTGRPSIPSTNVTMPMQPPAAAPRNVGASGRSSSSIMVQWQSPPADQWNGDILGYYIRYRLYGYVSAEWNAKNVSNGLARNALLDSLITWREYEIQVAAYNDRGMGVFSKPVIANTLEGVPLQSPQNVAVHVLNSTSVSVSFDPPEQQMIPGVNLGFKVELWNKMEQLVRQVQVLPEYSTITKQLDDLEKFGHYNLTVLCFTQAGDGPRSDPLPFITDQDYPGAIERVNISDVMFDSVVVSWDLPTHANGIITKYSIRYWAIGDEIGIINKEVDAQERILKIEGLVPSTKYMVEVAPNNKVGKGPSTSAKFESGVPPELPGKPSKIVISNVNSRNCRLSFTPGFDGHTVISKWIVEARSGSSSIYSQIFNISAPYAESFVVQGLRPYTRYQLRLIAENVRGRGPPSEPSASFETNSDYPEDGPDGWNGQPSGYVIRYRPTNELHDWNELRSLNLKSTEFMVQGLKPFTSYEMYVTAENTVGQSNVSQSVFATTYEGEPSGAPQNVEMLLNSHRGIDVSWSAVPETERNGIIRGYKVLLVPDEERLRRSHTKETIITEEDTFIVSFKNLRPYTSYRAFVSALTIVGEGPRGSLSNSVVTPEDVAGEPSNVGFSYVSETELNLKWTPPMQPNGRIINYSIRYGKDKNDKDAVVTQLPHSVYGFLATSLKPYTRYFFAIQAETSVGLGPEVVVDVVTSSYRQPVVNPAAPEVHSTKLPTDKQIWIRWHTPENGVMDEAPVRSVYIDYREDGASTWTSMLHSVCFGKKEAVLPNLRPNTAYRVRIMFRGDFSQSDWSSESAPIKTSEAIPSSPPGDLRVVPLESASVRVQWEVPTKATWNSESVGYRVLYKIYPSNDSYQAEDISKSGQPGEQISHVIKRLTSFRHYIVTVQTVNSFGNSVSSRPKFVYVGYSIPKQRVEGLTGESISSTSLRITWDPWKEKDGDAINGYKVRYVPVVPLLDRSKSFDDSTLIEEDVVISDNNSVVLTELKKFCEYQVSVSGYNRAGESEATMVRLTTLEDLPGPISNIVFTDILLDSVNVSWSPPDELNGHIVSYTVTYHTKDETIRKETVHGEYAIIGNLNENSTYYFSVKAQTGAGSGEPVSSNVTIAATAGAPEPPNQPILIPEQTSFTMRWHDGTPGSSPIKGHLVQAKRIATSKDTLVSKYDQRTKRALDQRPKHVIGEWVTIANIDGQGSEYQVDYRLLVPASYYVFRVFARNTLGIGHPSVESEQLHVPDFIPDDPFYTKWWFIVMVGLITFVIVVIVISLLCVTGSAANYRYDKRRTSVDSLQLAENVVSYELRGAQRKSMKHNRPRDVPSRPDTNTSWISEFRDHSVYGSIAENPENADNGPYGALATDVLPTGSHYVMRGGTTPAFDIVSNRAAADSGRPISDVTENTYAFAKFNASNRVCDDNFDSVNGQSLNCDDEPDVSIARHYGGDDEIYRATWRRARDQASRQQRSDSQALPPPPPPPDVALPHRPGSFTESGDSDFGEDDIPVGDNPSVIHSVHDDHIVTAAPSRVSNGFSSFPTVLYFSAGWCRSCRLFTPKLKRFYDNVDGDMNVVWVSRDKSAEDQLEYYEKSLGPWPYIPFGNELIKEYLQNYEVKTIPAILLVGENGKVVDDAIRGKIENCCSPEDAKKIISEWKGQ
ncbi:hypothetical protein QR680_002272 [Steinernema hermaphroditum]|uniref:Protein sidekick n=1 Tax=Steinernema hermaphroditum TaxID=289476 RepID=A0AA39H241_9BILA|nr:hypothetical protein QR680_002272 [Steinernema hermaphroditum]